jgi:predicted amidohydrolase
MTMIPAARAIECQTYVIAAAQYGQHNEKRSSYGHSLVVDPWGTVLADAGGVDDNATVGTSIVTAEIDLDMIQSVRQRMPVQQHREAANLESKTHS